MRLVSWNVNGLRAASRSPDYRDLFQDETIDVIALQEIKCTPDQLDFWQLNPEGMKSFWFPAKKPGYSGVAVFTRKEPKNVEYGFGHKLADSEGRVLQVEFDDFILINSYFPNAQRDHARLDYKLDFNEAMLKHCQKLRKKGQNVVLCGDFNVAHQEIDLKNPQSNKNNSGFLPQEREWMSRFLDAGYIDAFRRFHGGPGHYTWWSYRPGVRDRNIGWRIDYHVVNQEFAHRLEFAKHLPEVKGSDHCPVMLEVN